MNLTRASGILLHPTSLPCSPGIGTIGKQAYRFIDWLHSANQTLWQVLPIGPTGYGDSPYASFSTFAGNPLMIDLDDLVKNGWADKDSILPPEYIKSQGNVDFGAVVYWKIPVLKQAAEYFLCNCNNKDREAFEAFKDESANWLDNFSIFMSIKEFYDAKAQEEDCFGAMWSNYWPQPLAAHDDEAVSQWYASHTKEAELHKVIQFFFFHQWYALKKYANQKGVVIIGDIPIFVAADSADVWANQHLFQLDKNGKSTAIAGVPPDYFSATGQLWGNPLYDWDEMKKDGYKWWIQRIKSMQKVVDYVRIDHFRGFEAYWSVPADEKTAVNGKWIPGPDHDLFKTIKNELGDIPIIAEDLGLITEGVRKLRDDFDLPGMKILQFAFDVNESGKGGCVNPFLPHMFTQNCVVYTGTHDNDTMQGWIDNASDEEIKLISEYLTGSPTVLQRNQLCQQFVRLAFSSVAKFAVIPIQDLFALGQEGRINTPSTSDGKNWIWRMPESFFDKEVAARLKRLSELYARNITIASE